MPYYPERKPEPSGEKQRNTTAAEKRNRLLRLSVAAFFSLLVLYGVRVGSYKKKLKEYPEKERKLWRTFEIRPYETMPAKENVDAGMVTQLLDTGAFYALMELPIPSTRDGVMHDFQEYEFIRRIMDDKWIEAVVSLLMRIQDEENRDLPLYERQLQETNVAINNRNRRKPVRIWNHLGSQKPDRKIRFFVAPGQKTHLCRRRNYTI